MKALRAHACQRSRPQGHMDHSHNPACAHPAGDEQCHAVRSPRGAKTVLGNRIASVNPSAVTPLAIITGGLLQKNPQDRTQRHRTCVDAQSRRGRSAPSSRARSSLTCPKVLHVVDIVINTKDDGRGGVFCSDLDVVSASRQSGDGTQHNESIWNDAVGHRRLTFRRNRHEEMEASGEIFSVKGER